MPAVDMPKVVPDVILVCCTHPPDGAEALATALVEARLAACVQVVPGVRSTYRWEGKVESAEESRLDLKTTADRLPALILMIQQLHPYDLPEIVALPMIGGSEQYLDWIREQTRHDS